MTGDIIEEKLGVYLLQLTPIMNASSIIEYPQHVLYAARTGDDMPEDSLCMVGINASA